MKYNTDQNKLINGEYGRNIQKMIEYCVDIKDRTLRNQQAKAIVRAMSHFATGNKETEDYWHKLWDHLFVISDFKLEIDAPFPKPTVEQIKHPKPMPYPNNKIRFRPYGLLSEKILKKLTLEKDSPQRDQVVECMANQLKRQYLSWNRDSVNDTLIIEHLVQLSSNKLKLKEGFTFTPTKVVLSEIAEIAEMNKPPAPVKKTKQAPVVPPQPNPNSAKKKKKNTALQAASANNKSNVGKPQQNPPNQHPKPQQNNGNNWNNSNPKPKVIVKTNPNNQSHKHPFNKPHHGNQPRKPHQPNPHQSNSNQAQETNKTQD